MARFLRRLHQSEFHALILCVVGRVAVSPIASLQLRSYMAYSGQPLLLSLPACAPETFTSLTPGRTRTEGLALLGAFWAKQLPECLTGYEPWGSPVAPGPPAGPAGRPGGSKGAGEAPLVQLI